MGNQGEHDDKTWFQDALKELEQEEFYHGLLPREDLPYLLKEVGDFILRVTQPKVGDPRELIISVRVSSKEDPSAACSAGLEGLAQLLQATSLTQDIHIESPGGLGILDLNKKKKGDKIRWRINDEAKFDSVKELIKTYLENGKPINPEVKTSQLINGIGQQPWEFHHENVRLKEMLGEGQFGEVRAAVAVINGRRLPVAVKIAKEIKSAKEEEQAKEKVKEMMHEARLMRHFEHDNVVKIHGVAVLHEPLMIIIEMVVFTRTETISDSSLF